MDSITQRFVATGKKLLAELRNIGDALRALRDDINKQTEAIGKSNNPESRD